MSFESDDAESPAECPLCMDELDISDRNFKPCPCGYQICRFCWHHILTNLTGQCPACRRAYDKTNVEFKPIPAEALAKVQAEKRQRTRERKELQQTSRKHLQNVRVVQKNLVYVSGLPARLASEDLLKSPQYFGKFGKIIKLVISRRPIASKDAAVKELGSTLAVAGARESSPEPFTSASSSSAPKQSASPSVSIGVYVTYVKAVDAAEAIAQVDGALCDGKMLRASHGTTKYCSYYLRHTPCPNPGCMYLHEHGEDADSYQKDEVGSLMNSKPNLTSTVQKHFGPKPTNGAITTATTADTTSTTNTTTATVPPVSTSLRTPSMPVRSSPAASTVVQSERPRRSSTRTTTHRDHSPMTAPPTMTKNTHERGFTEEAEGASQPSETPSRSLPLSTSCDTKDANTVGSGCEENGPSEAPTALSDDEQFDSVDDRQPEAIQWEDAVEESGQPGQSPAVKDPPTEPNVERRRSQTVGSDLPGLPEGPGQIPVSATMPAQQQAKKPGVRHVQAPPGLDVLVPLSQFMSSIPEVPGFSITPELSKSGQTPRPPMAPSVEFGRFHSATRHFMSPIELPDSPLKSPESRGTYKGPFNPFVDHFPTGSRESGSGTGGCAVPHSVENNIPNQTRDEPPPGGLSQAPAMLPDQALQSRFGFARSLYANNRLHGLDASSPRSAKGNEYVTKQPYHVQQGLPPLPPEMLEAFEDPQNRDFSMAVGDVNQHLLFPPGLVPGLTEPAHDPSKALCLADDSHYPSSRRLHQQPHQQQQQQRGRNLFAEFKNSSAAQSISTQQTTYQPSSFAAEHQPLDVRLQDPNFYGHGFRRVHSANFTERNSPTSRWAAQAAEGDEFPPGFDVRLFGESPSSQPRQQPMQPPPGFEAKAPYRPDPMPVLLGNHNHQEYGPMNGTPLTDFPPRVRAHKSIPSPHHSQTGPPRVTPHQHQRGFQDTRPTSISPLRVQTNPSHSFNLSEMNHVLGSFLKDVAANDDHRARDNVRRPAGPAGKLLECFPLSLPLFTRNPHTRTHSLVPLAHGYEGLDDPAILSFDAWKGEPLKGRSLDPS